MRGLARFRDPGLWRGLGAGVGLALFTVLVAAAYVMEPQSPRDFADRLTLAVGGDAYGPNLRSGSRLYARAVRARAAGADSLADAYLWRAAAVYTRASEAAPGPRETMVANDGLSAAYLDLGWRYLERGRGGVFGLGRQPEALAAAERVASCLAGVAPTRRRAQINTFLVELEETLERPVSGRCPG